MSLSAIKVRENQFVFICTISIKVKLEQDGGVWAIIVLNALICLISFSKLFLTGVLVRYDEQVALRFTLLQYIMKIFIPMMSLMLSTVAKVLGYRS